MARALGVHVQHRLIDRLLAKRNAAFERGVDT